MMYSFYPSLQTYGVQPVLHNVQTGCIVKGEAQKIHFLAIFMGEFNFLRCACSPRIPVQDPLDLTNLHNVYTTLIVNPLVFTMALVCILLIVPTYPVKTVASLL